MLERRNVQVAEERSSRKRPLTTADVRGLLAEVDTVIVAKGKKADAHRARDVRPDDLRGPTGNFRAPMVRHGRTLLVGFHAESLETLL